VAVAAPVGGGSYEGDVRLAGQTDEDKGQITLQVANDGLSFDAGYIAFLAPCGPHSSFLVQQWPAATTLIDASGGFAWSTSTEVGSFEAAGHFAQDGSAVDGRMSFVGDPERCVARDVPFHATLTGRPGATRPGQPAACGPVPARDGEIHARERGLGCTPAKLLAVAWAHRAECKRSPSRPGCVLEGFSCTGVHGAKYSRQASVRCTATPPAVGAVEFDIEAGCGYLHSERINLYRLNIDCRTATRVVRRIPAACVEAERVGHQCDAGPYRCRITELTGDSTLGRCHSRRDPFRALRFEYVWPL
jgi:hypothetical protein